MPAARRLPGARAARRLPGARAARRPRPHAIADWLTLIAGVALFASLFLTWSHQFSPAIRALAPTLPALQGVPPDPTAWQVYSVADALLALLAAALIVVALAGPAAARACVLIAAVLALLFVIHALSVPPTNGVLVTNPANPGGYLPRAATSGAGEVVALIALGTGIAGLALSFAPD